MKNLKITLKDLFNFCGMTSVNYDEFTENTREIYIKTPDNDWVKINGFIKKQDKKLFVEFKSGRFFICGENHIVVSRDGLSYIKDSSNVLNVLSEDYDEIVNKEDLDYGDVYDISIDAPHLYLTPNGFVHHNTTIAKALCEEVGCDYLFINASTENGIDVLRNQITNYATSVSLSGGRKVVILDESDGLSPNFQNGMKSFLEQFSQNCSFIFTCNHKNKIIEPIHSRCSVIDVKITKEDKPALMAQFFKRVLMILDTEGVQYNKDVVAKIIAKYHPDNRRVLNELQRYSLLGQIDTGILTQVSDINLSPLIKSLKEKNFGDVRKWLVNNLDSDSVTIYRKMYDQMYDFLEPNSIPQLVLLIGRYQYQTAFVADAEINLMAFFTECLIDLEFR